MAAKKAAPVGALGLSAGADTWAMQYNVLGYREEGEWVALALELDLRGYGPTFEDALAEVEDLVIDQVSFAIMKNEPGLIYSPAEPPYFERFTQALFEALAEAEGTRDSRDRIAGVPIPPPHVIAAMKSERGWAAPGRSAR